MHVRLYYCTNSLLQRLQRACRAHEEIGNKFTSPKLRERKVYACMVFGATQTPAYQQGGAFETHGVRVVQVVPLFWCNQKLSNSVKKRKR